MAAAVESREERDWIPSHGERGIRRNDGWYTNPGLYRFTYLLSDGTVVD